MIPIIPTPLRSILMREKIRMTHTHRFVSLAISFLLLAFQTISANDVVVRTCKASAARDRNVRLDFCVRSLGAVPESRSADLFLLGAISLELIERNVTGTGRYIESLLKKKPSDSFVKPRLKDCEELYSDAGETLRGAAGDYTRKRYGEANVKLSSVMDSVTTCEDGFEEKEGGVSPLRKRNGDAFQLTAIALCIVSMHP